MTIWVGGKNVGCCLVGQQGVSRRVTELYKKQRVDQSSVN